MSCAAAAVECDEAGGGRLRRVGGGNRGSAAIAEGRYTRWHRMQVFCEGGDGESPVHALAPVFVERTYVEGMYATSTCIAASSLRRRTVSAP